MENKYIITLTGHDRRFNCCKLVNAKEKDKSEVKQILKTTIQESKKNIQYHVLEEDEGICA